MELRRPLELPEPVERRREVSARTHVLRPTGSTGDLSTRLELTDAGKVALRYARTPDAVQNVPSHVVATELLSQGERLLADVNCARVLVGEHREACERREQGEPCIRVGHSRRIALRRREVV